MLKQLKKKIYSIGTLLALVISIIVVIYLPDFVRGELAEDLLSIGVNVLVVICAASFAALVFIISASDDEFVVFLEKEGAFTDLINTFKWTLAILFTGLIYTLSLYLIVLFRYSQNPTFEVHEVTICIYSFLFFYGLFLTLSSAREVIIYAQTRIEYLKVIKHNKNMEMMLGRTTEKPHEEPQF